MHVQKYIGKLDEQIDKLIRKESGGLTDAERDLHVLFENREHVKRWAEGVGSSIDTTGMDNPHKTYFGGV